LHSYPSQLSGGQRQRVAVARALAMKPEVIICDEPTSALDVSVQASILNMLQDLRTELNLTYLFISHDLSVVEHLSARVAVMYLGHLIEFGTVDQVFDHPRHPYTRVLLRSVMTPDPSLGLPDIGLGSGFPNPLDPPSGCTFHPRCPEALDKCSQQEPGETYSADGLLKCHLAN
ncbi:MAG: ABC transporter ATP-binding protein, partial [Rhodospirillales bacterium]|nr:ABC transporter ATP-binding protein [Rhodospirillales bacterium]